MKNYCTETDLKGYFPELDLYKWGGETDFSKFKAGAETKVCLDLKNKGYDLRKLQTPLMLINSTLFSSKTTETVEDKTNRLRFVYELVLDVPELTPEVPEQTSIILQGANTSSGGTVWTDIINIDTTTSITSSSVFTDAYKYYRLKYESTGNASSNIFLIETNYDILFIYKWLELIMMNGSKQQNDKYWLKMLYFKENYDAQLNSMVISIDENEDGEIESSERVTTNTVEYVR